MHMCVYIGVNVYIGTSVYPCAQHVRVCASRCPVHTLCVRAECVTHVVF